jgi:hypothetical protein
MNRYKTGAVSGATNTLIMPFILNGQQSSTNEWELSPKPLLTLLKPVKFRQILLKKKNSVPIS